MGCVHMTTNYCLVGAGSRGIHMYAVPIVQDYRDIARLTGVCDANPGRVDVALGRLGSGVQGFTDFYEMLDTVDCDVVIVATQDSTHDEFIIGAMRRGKDVITEKPMAINDEKCRAILAAERETGRKVTVTFNARYFPYATKIRELVQEGLVGEVQSVEFAWHLDTVHGADFFRRWHRKKENSGGLLVHKSTHHFDLVNWWIAADPTEVAAMGSRRYYTESRQPDHGERCLTCPPEVECAFRMRIDSGQMKHMYLDQEQHDGYIRDNCIFSSDTDIEDTMSLLVRYERGIQLTYALTAATPFEGWKVAINGSLGRLEGFYPEAFVVEENQTDFSRRRAEDVRQRVNWEVGAPSAMESVDALEIRFYPLFGGLQTFSVEAPDEEHGGGDRILRDQLFRSGQPDPFSRLAGSRAGAMSIGIGIAGNKSMAENRFVRMKELLQI